MHASTVDKSQFLTNGFIVLRNLLDADEVIRYKHSLEMLAAGRGPKWTIPDGVCQYPEFWDVLFNEKILTAVKSLLGQDIKFLQHNDLHVGFSSFHWHRDSVCRHYGKGPDWDESTDPYQLVRVGIYLQESTGGFRLGLVPGSHNPAQQLNASERSNLNRGSSMLAKAKTILGAKDPLETQAEWVLTNPGDCIIFDPRTIHTGSNFQGTKYSLFTAYGIENRHFNNHYNYYRYLRADLGYQALHPALVERLQAKQLYAGESNSVRQIDGAWLPSKTFVAVARHFK
ncbi:MAG: phytanoyl-CoA dioxygenase family protein [Saprospiraceae bacterium]|nr:phytanoyl-CoA dioxygenase family protein [Saprospiraceae bacterium]